MKPRFICRSARRKFPENGIMKDIWQRCTGLEDYVDSNVNNFNYQPKDPSQNFDSENLAQEFNSRAGYPTRNDNYLPDPLPLDPNYYEPNFTSNFHSDVTPNKKPNLFTLQRIFIKLSQLRIQLSSRIGPEKVDPIVAYLYYECIFHKSTKPLDDYLSRFDI